MSKVPKISENGRGNNQDVGNMVLEVAVVETMEVYKIVQRRAQSTRK